MELTFVHQYSGEAPKRRRLAKACESCRTRKKRCVHFAGAGSTAKDGREDVVVADDSESEDVEKDQANNVSTSSSMHRLPSSDRAIRQSSVRQTPPSIASKRGKFLSDMNPEAMLLNRPVPASDSRQKQPNDDIGVWVDRREWDALVKQKNDAANPGSNRLVANSDFHHAQRPHSAVLGPLIDIYFKKVHPVLPLLDEDEFRQDHAGGIVPEPLVHAMCLVAAKDSEAEPYLKLSDAPSTIPARQFCSILHGSVAAALRVPVRYEKVMLIRILALTSMHTEGPEGAEDASIWLHQAMHYGQTLGIHLGQQASAPVGNDLLMKRLFWCLWGLDRLSAATSGRPVIMSDVDMAIEPIAPGETGFPAFEAWIKISHILNKVIGFYRPTNGLSVTGWEGDYPTLEGIIDEVGGWQLPASLLATIHLFFLIVGILSHRERGVKELSCGKNSHIRQRLFAIEIVRLMDAPKATTLHPLPILPYAISLALSVSYQHLRQSQLEHQQADARQDFRVCCRILQNLRRTWCSADVMATLAKKVLDELDRAQDLSTFRIRRNPKHALVPDRAVIPPPTACHYGVGAVERLPATKEKLAEADTPQHSDAIAGASAKDPQTVQGGVNWFDNMDDVFGTFMDPNYPLNLEDMFIDDLTPFDWNAAVSTGSQSLVK